MSRIRANGIEIEYESIGEGEPILLVMGLGSQLVMWPDDFCHELAERGFEVIRFDNRDVGLSTKLRELGVPRVRRLLVRALLGLPVKAPYTLVDMADDAVGLLDALEIQDAHVVGVSMGGMIAQTMAIVHPSRLRSLTSIMSSPGDRLSMLGKPFAIRALLGPAARSREEAIALKVEFFRICGGSGYPLDESLLSDQAGKEWDRGPYPAGFARHFAAILATGDRRGALRFVRTPTLVLHGAEDPLMLPSAARATARAIPKSRLRLIPGMGHRLPRGAWPIIIDEISNLAQKTQ